VVETSRRFALERGGPERLDLRWGPSFRQVRVLFDDVEVTVLERKKIPRDGVKVTLPDGSVLSVRLRGVLGIELFREGGHLPGSDLEPRRLLRNAAALMAVAALADGAIDGAMARRAMAATAELGVPFPRSLTMGLALDAVLLVLVVPTALGSRVALGLGIAAFASRFGLGVERSSWTLIYGVATTWLLATHFFATLKRRAPRSGA
jgi:hypothetical protein